MSLLASVPELLQVMSLEFEPENSENPPAIACPDISLNESTVEDTVSTSVQELSYAIGHGLQMVPGEPTAERESFGDVVLLGPLRDAIALLNPSLPEAAREEALR